MKKIMVTALAMLLIEPVLADVQMTILDGRGSTSVISSDGERARFDEKGSPEYAVINILPGK